MTRCALVVLALAAGPGHQALGRTVARLDSGRPAKAGGDWLKVKLNRPWGQALPYDEKEARAREREGFMADAVTDLHLLEPSMKKAEAEPADAGVVAPSILEGYAEPLRETPGGISLISDPWDSQGGTDVTFSYGTHCHARSGCRGSGYKKGHPSFQEMRRNVLASLRALRFCFSDVLIVLDAPHSGHDKRGPETPGNMSSHTIVPLEGASSRKIALIGGRSVTNYRVDARLAREAVAVAMEAAALLRNHCVSQGVLWKVKSLDYASDELRKQALKHYAIPEKHKNSSFFDHMYINTMALTQNFEARGKYVYHMDAQWRIYRTNSSRSGGDPNFITKAIDLMRSDDRVYMASVINSFNLEPQHNPYSKFGMIPGAVHSSTPEERVKGLLQGWSPEAWLSQSHPLQGEAFRARWREDSDEPSIALFKMKWDTFGGAVSRHQFLMNVERFHSLLPLQGWDMAAERMWSESMNKKKHGAFQIYFNETVGVFAGPSESS